MKEARAEAQLKIAYCLPVQRSRDTTDTSILLQYLIAGQLQARGHQVSIAAASDPANLSVLDGEEFRPVARTWTAGLPFRAAKSLSWRVQQLLGIPHLAFFSNLSLMDACLQFLPGHDLVQERMGLYKTGAAQASRRLGLPYILFFDSDEIFEHDLLGDPIRGLLRRRAAQVIRANLRTARRILVVSQAAKERLETVWQVPGEKVAVFPNAVDVRLYRPYPEDRDAVRSELGARGAPLITFVGSFFPWQDLDLLLQAFSQVLPGHPSARLVLVGDGERKEAVSRLAGELGIARSVTFTGFLPQAQVARIVSASDILVAPYTPMDSAFFYGSSMKLVEYMAGGAAIVATALGQIREVIQHGESGLLVSPGSREELAAALLGLLGDDRLRERLGRRAREDAIAKYSWEQYITRLEQLYRAVLSEGPVRARSGSRVVGYES